jgi:hypothetical protein
MQEQTSEFLENSEVFKAGVYRLPKSWENNVTIYSREAWSHPTSCCHQSWPASVQQEQPPGRA